MPAPERELGNGGEEKETFVQPAFEDFDSSFEPPQEEEVLLEACIVTREPTSTKQGKRPQWDCSVDMPPDIFNQDRNICYELHATDYAQEAKRMKLRPGDVVTLRGTLWTQTLELQGGTRTINHLTVSEITVLSRSQRIKVTLWEQERQGK